MTLELVPLCIVEITLDDAILVGAGGAGFRAVAEVVDMTVTGERLNGRMKGRAAADWVTVSGAVGTVDVRATFETHDGAVIYTSYRGRMDMSQGPGALPIYAAPTFETGDARYAWLNLVQAAGKGQLADKHLRYEWFELR